MNQILNLHFPVARPPWTGLGKRLESMCRKALYEFELLEGVGKVAVALSGGKDSLTLLYLLKAISGRGFPEIEICAVHVGGAFSCGAGIGQGYLRGICDEIGVEFIGCEAKQEREKLECYSCSRDRRTLIFEASKKAGATTVAFGHHRDDSVQTLLMNLLHKGEFAAMLAKVPMHDYGITIIRPLIYVAEEEIREFAKMYNFARVVCQCPVGQDSMRKHTKDLIAVIEKEFPNARENLSSASMLYGSKKALKR
ncbi:MAG: tRNA 2-thiocytidine biosynthesis protein TtcA [Candidatus Melainabacteria bacterium]|nr:tRNA 2-thiocytidine biosynthesis protein TtcA [Candidatus Melainabacteria bacterium]